MYMKGGPRGNYNHGYVSFGSTVAEERLHVGGSLKVTENINASGIITGNIIRATQGVDAPLYITESVDDNAEYNLVMLNGTGQGGNAYRVTMVDNGGITFNPFQNRLTLNNNVTKISLGSLVMVLTLLVFQLQSSLVLESLLVLLLVLSLSVQLDLELALLRL